MEFEDGEKKSRRGGLAKTLEPRARDESSVSEGDTDELGRKAYAVTTFANEAKHWD